MSNNTLEFFISNLTSCNPNNHYVKVTSFGDVWFAIYIIGIITTAIAGISTLNLIWRICRRSFGYRDKRIGIGFDDPEFKTDLTDIIDKEDNECLFAFYNIFKVVNYLVILGVSDLTNQNYNLHFNFWCHRGFIAFGLQVDTVSRIHPSNNQCYLELDEWNFDNHHLLLG